MQHPVFSINVNQHGQRKLNRDLVEFVVHIVTTDPFENEREKFEFFSDHNEQFVIRSQDSPSRCKGYRLPLPDEKVMETIYVKKEKETLILFTSKDEMLEL